MKNSTFTPEAPKPVSSLIHTHATVSSLQEVWLLTKVGIIFMLAIIKLIANAFTTISPEQWLFTGIGLIAILVIVVQIINVTGPLLEEGLLIGIGVFVIIFVVAIIWMGIDWLYDMVNNFFHGFDRW